MIFLLSLLPLLFAPLIRGDDSTRTILTFSRKLQTCDEQDREVEETGATKVIWSYSDVDPSDDNNIEIHTHRGSRTVHFTNQQQGVTLPPDTKHFYIGHKDNAPDFHRDPRTRYDCSAHRVELPDKPLQILRAEPVIDPKNVKTVHHIIIYVVYGEIPDEDLNFIGDCFEAVPSSFTGEREDMVMEWAVGGTTFDWPPHVGYRLEAGPKYFSMEIHYDNPKHEKIVDSSGMNFYYTENYFRQYDGGITSIGWNSADTRITLPPGLKEYQMHSYCFSDCTSRWPEGGIKVVAAKLHTHLHGRSGALKVIRDGQELKPVYTDPYYDFDYQDFAILPEEYSLLPGDVIRQECNYDTSDVTEPIHFGVATFNEMCHSWVMYYPKLSNNDAQCRYLDHSFLPGEESKGLANYCGPRQIFNIAPLPPYEQYVAPPCQPQLPPPEITTPEYKDKLNLNNYQQKLTLDENGAYNLYWSVDLQNRILNTAVEVKTSGWVGYGYGPYGMEGADVTIGWVKDHQVHFTDRFSKTQTLPDVDKEQDYFYIWGQEVTPSQGGYGAYSFLQTNASMTHFLKDSLVHQIPATKYSIPNGKLYKKNRTLLHHRMHSSHFPLIADQFLLVDQSTMKKKKK